MKVYEVWEQWPHKLIAIFWKLEDAIDFMKANKELALPIITSIELGSLIQDWQ